VSLPLDPSLPPICIRPALPADSPACARVRVDTWRQAYQGLMPADILAKLSYERAEKAWRESLWENLHPGSFGLVAEDAPGQVVGVLMGGRERSGDPLHTGEIYVLYILPAYQRRGVGRGLFSAAVRRLQDDGYPSLLIWVLEKNPWRAFYDAMGGKPLRTAELDIGGVKLVEVAYGWGESSLLIADSS
jgi:GNAT superfamily N-acetyltransferase